MNFQKIQRLNELTEKWIELSKDLEMLNQLAIDIIEEDKTIEINLVSDEENKEQEEAPNVFNLQGLIEFVKRDITSQNIFSSPISTLPALEIIQILKREIIWRQKQIERQLKRNGVSLKKLVNTT